MVYPISKRFFWFILSKFVKEIKGLENIPPPPAIIACNHESDIDGILLYFLLLKEKNKLVFPILSDERVANPVGDLFAKHFNAVRVNSGAVKKCVAALKKGHYVLIFPEGQRTFTGKIQKVSHTGLGVISILSKAPVVPARIHSYKFWSRYMRFPNFKNKMSVNFGKPQLFKGKITNSWVDKDDAKRVISSVMESIKELN